MSCRKCDELHCGPAPARKPKPITRADVKAMLDALVAEETSTVCHILDIDRQATRDFVSATIRRACNRAVAAHREWERRRGPR